jgi:hypothetical protein
VTGLTKDEIIALLDALSLQEGEVEDIAEHNPELASALAKLKRWSKQRFSKHDPVR